MRQGRSTARIATAATAAAAGLLAALLLEAPLAAALLALLAGAGAAALALATGTEAPSASEPPAEPAAQPPAGLIALMRALDEPMLLVRDRHVLAANEAGLRLLGGHIVGTDVRVAIRHPAAAERLAGPETADEAPTTRTELVGLAGAERAWAMTATRLEDGSRLVRLSDLSQFRAAEKMRADFVANASHELRTPLSTLLGFLETLQDEDTAADPATRGRFVRIMFDEAKRMQALVEDLMSLSRIEAERYDVPADPVDLAPIVESVRHDLAALAESHGSEIVSETEARSTMVYGDRGQLGQLLANLVTNALNYGRAGAPVRVRLEEGAAGMLCLSVVDQGEGIAAEHIPRLTERFYRVDPGRSRSVGGTGLGLAIAKHIALRHRGRLEIVSKPGEGTSVRVYLPHLSRTETL
jgi:two-component system phosphate regulon sensor histidine kinase PhoR